MSDFTSVGIVMLIVGSAAVGAGRSILERRRARRELARRAPLAAHSPEGEVLRVTGVVRIADDTIVAPLSGRECVVARSRVRSGKSWVAYAENWKESIAMVPFLIDRGEEGTVRVEGKHVLLDLPPLDLKRRDIPTERRSQFMALHALGVRDTGRAHFSETIVEPGARVSVAGLLMKDVPAAAVPDDERGFRDELPAELRIAGNVEHPIVIGRPID